MCSRSAFRNGACVGLMPPRPDNASCSPLHKCEAQINGDKRNADSTDMWSKPSRHQRARRLAKCEVRPHSVTGGPRGHEYFPLDDLTIK
jgi:hypothetical protein